jgi:hypothetical protein
LILPHLMVLVSGVVLPSELHFRFLSVQVFVYNRKGTLIGPALYVELNNGYYIVCGGVTRNLIFSFQAA